MDCINNCPKVQEFEQVKESLREQLVHIESLRTVTDLATNTNRETRRAMAKLDKKTAHDALRQVSNAEFYTSESERMNKEAEEANRVAIEAQDVVINALIATCEAGCPAVQGSGSEYTLVCSSPVATDL